MSLPLSASLQYVVLALIIVGAVLVFSRVKSEYLNLGKLSPQAAWFQTGYFFLYALSSYLILDSGLRNVDTRGFVFPLALFLMVTGVFVIAATMPFLGSRSFGGHVGSLHTTGLYRYSRNPQLLGGFLFVVGYALLWPTVQGMLWAATWLVISHLMVRAEEAHLQDVFGDEYAAYCARTPRYIGIPRDRAPRR